MQNEPDVVRLGDRHQALVQAHAALEEDVHVDRRDGASAE
jgi:hypothetical protein